MAERGQRTTLRFGGVSAEVSLVKSSGKPPADVQHETLRVLVKNEVPVTITENPNAGPGMPSVVIEEEARAMFSGPVVASEPIPADVPVQLDGRGGVIEHRGDLGPREAAQAGGYPIDPAEIGPVAAKASRDVFAEANETLGLGLNVDESPSAAVDAVARESEDVDIPDDLPRRFPPEQHDAAREALTAPPQNVEPLRPAPNVVPGAFRKAVFGDVEQAQEYVPPETKVQQGVTVGGEWVDLTDRLALIDERCKVDGLEVVCTIASNAVPRERVREAYYVNVAEAKGSKVLALVWHALRDTGMAAVVRWTKRTAQSCGIIVARGTLGFDAHLVLLEVEWAEAMRGPGPKATQPIELTGVTQAELSAAQSLVQSFHAPPRTLDELSDSRIAKRRELLTLAREGKLSEYVDPPAPESVTAGSLLDAMNASAAARA